MTSVSTMGRTSQGVASKDAIIKRRRAASRVGGGHVELSYDWIHVVASPLKGGEGGWIRGPSHKAAVRNQTTKYFPKLVTDSSVHHLLLSEVKVTMPSKSSGRHT